MLVVPIEDVAERDEYVTYNGELFTGTTEEYKNGRLISQKSYLQGIPHGLQRTWNENGQLDSEETLCMFQLHGYGRGWFPNGQLAYETLAEHGYPIHERRWDEQGSILLDQRMPLPAEQYERLRKEREEAQRRGFGPPEGIDCSLLPP